MDEKELRKLALDIRGGAVFTSAQVHPSEAPDILHMVFIPLAFMEKKDLVKMRKDKIMVVYEYLDKALPRSVNGYPIFASMNLILEKKQKLLGRTLKQLHTQIVS